ncbi:MAG: hypothetical protein RMK99_08690 [Anaerolineales bacterium]|nr:hypothetical protein [Anaerolineales bacterium]
MRSNGYSLLALHGFCAAAGPGRVLLGCKPTPQHASDTVFNTELPNLPDI